MQSPSAPTLQSARTTCPSPTPGNCWFHQEGLETSSVPAQRWAFPSLHNWEFASLSRSDTAQSRSKLTGMRLAKVFFPPQRKLLHPSMGHSALERLNFMALA